MLLEIILYFLLGFFCAVMLALIIAPTIWNRAVVLTKQKVENSLPLNLNEIQAEKDKLRAEFAMSSRRLELGIEELREKASEQLIELHSKRDETNRLNREQKESQIKIEGLETAATAMQTTLEQNQERIEQQTVQLEETNQELSALRETHNALRLQNSQTGEELNQAKINLVASDSRVESLSAALATLNLTDEEQVSKIKSLHQKNVQLQLDLKEEKRLLKAASAEAKSTAKKLQTATAKLERLGNTPKTAKGAANKLKEKVSELTSELIAGNAKVVELEAKLAHLALRSDAQPESTTNSATIQSLKDESTALASEIRGAAKTNGIKADKKEALRGKLKGIAAKTAATVAASEGKESAITKITNATPEATGTHSEATLADKIRALQTAEAQKS